MEHSLITAIKRYTPLPASEADLVLSYFTEKKYKRNQVLLQEGKVAHEAFFVLNGLIRQYYTDEAGNERTCNFTFENEFGTDLESFSRQSKSASSIKALAPSVCMTISCTDLVKAFNESPVMVMFFRSIVEEIAKESIRRTKSLLSLSPEKQFLELIEEKPGLLQNVPQRYIAQYLGIAPESLSRIRKRLMVEKS